MTKDEDEIRAAFNRACDRVDDARRRNDPGAYWRAVMDALGWVLEEYDDDPTEN